MTSRLPWALRPFLSTLSFCSLLIAQQPGWLPADQKLESWMPPVKAPDPVAASPLPDPSSAPSIDAATLPMDAAFAGGGRLPDTVLHDERGDVLWALGHDYKASFAADGMTFIPYFGASAPRNFPIRFTITGIHVGNEALPVASRHLPQREGDRIRIERGACVEVYDLGLRAVEQSFVFPPLAAAGDLCVRLRADSELAMAATQGGLEFRGEHGTVTYRKAIVLDGAGRREAIAIEPAGQGDAGRGDFVLRVPQRFLAAAAGAITIDPIVSTFFPATGTPFDFNPDVTFTAGTIVTTWQRVWSSTDHDVFMEWRVPASVFAIDFTSENWEKPRIAGDATLARVFVVAQVGLPWLPRVIKGRVAVLPNGFGIPVRVSGSEIGDAINCDIGGDSSGLPGTVFCVVWEREVSATDRDILFRIVNPADYSFGTPFSVPVDNSTMSDSRPRIAKTCGPAAGGAARFWPVVWQRRFSSTDEDIRGALIGSAGGIVLPSFSIDFAAANDTSPVVSSPSVPFGASTFGGGRAFMVAYERTMPAGGRNVHARVLSGSSSLTAAVDLSAISAPATAATLDQLAPSVDCDGTRFVVAHVERSPFAPTGDNDAFVSTWRLAGGLTLHETPRRLNSGVSGEAERNASIANVPGTTLFPVVFERVNSTLTDRDVFGAVFDSNLAAGSFITGGCPLSPMMLFASTMAPTVPGNSRTLTLSSGFAFNPIIAMGPEVSAFMPCLPCTVHVDLNSATFATGPSFTFTVPADPRLVGSRFAAQAFGDCGICVLAGFGTGCFAVPLTYSNAIVFPIN